MTESCPSCGAPLFYNPELQVSECRRCGGFYFPEEIAAAEKRAESLNSNYDSVEADEDSDISPEYIEEFIDSQIYSCSQCGAEIIVNSTEASTFCVFCGCPSMIFSRISKTRKPQYIIPFQISKEEALGSIREKMKRSFFAPKAVRQIKPDDIHGIYIPYWLTDIDYEGIANVEYYRKPFEYYFGKSVEASKVIRTCKNAVCSFKQITTDASYTLPNSFTQRLEPYDLKQLRPFDKDYLAGFHSDIANISYAEGKEDALERAEQMFDEEMVKALKSFYANISVTSKVGHYQILNCESAMLPAWFITFKYEGLNYTLAVNGQTGKVNGALPISYKKFTILCVLMTLILWGLFIFETIINSANFLAMIACIFVIGIAMMGAGISKVKRVRQRIRQSRSNFMYTYVHNRQGGDWK